MKTHDSRRRAAPGTSSCGVASLHATSGIIHHWTLIASLASPAPWPICTVWVEIAYTLAVYVWERDYVRRHRLEPGNDAKLSPFSGPFFQSGPCFSHVPTKVHCVNRLIDCKYHKLDLTPVLSALSLQSQCKLLYPIICSSL